MEGVAGADGIVVGRVYRLADGEMPSGARVARRSRTGRGRRSRRSRHGSGRPSGRLRAAGRTEEAEILEAGQLMADDPSLLAEVEALAASRSAAGRPAGGDRAPGCAAGGDSGPVPGGACRRRPPAGPAGGAPGPHPNLQPPPQPSPTGRRGEDRQVPCALPSPSQGVGKPMFARAAEGLLGRRVRSSRSSSWRGTSGRPTWRKIELEGLGGRRDRAGRGLGDLTRGDRGALAGRSAGGRAWCGRAGR